MEVRDINMSRKSLIISEKDVFIAVKIQVCEHVPLS